MMKARFLMTMVLACSHAHDLYGQSNFYGVWRNPAMTPRDRRFVREQAVAYAGPYSRTLVESEIGDVAAFALLRCSQNGAAVLASFYASGGLVQLPRAKDLLVVIAQPDGGDPVCKYIIQHANELMDPDCCNAFLATPLDFVWGWKQLPVPAEKSRAQCIPSPWLSSPSMVFGYERRSVAWTVGLVGVVVLVMWRRQRRLARNLPA
jgi:hypothetical protein